MKKIVIISVSLLSIFISTQGFSKGGFSLGVFGSLATDGGAIEKTFDNHLPASDKDSLIIPGAGIFARYEFNNNLFIRMGVEHNEIIFGGEVSTHSSFQNFEYQMEYSADSFPILFGINVSPDKGKTNIYGAVGLVMARISIRQSEEGIASGNPYTRDSETDNFIPGFGGLFGIEKRITKDFYFMIEYAFYQSEITRTESAKYTSFGIPQPDQEYTERYGLPRQQIRLGLRYGF